MSCMEHVCRGCGHTEMDNKAAGGSCPRCGGETTTTFDEEFDRDPPEGDDDDDA